MTFKEKLMQDYPDRDTECSITYDCPDDFGCEETNENCDGNCTECWNREILKVSKMTTQEAINVMQKYTDETISKVVVEAHQMAIKALKKQLPVKVDEDLELTPEQIRQIDKLYREKCEELAEYKKLEEQGLLLKLPCKVGDKAYHVIEDHIAKPPIYVSEHTIQDVTAKAVHFADMWWNLEEMDNQNAFLDKAKAEQRLAEMRGEVDEGY